VMGHSNDIMILRTVQQLMVSYSYSVASKEYKLAQKQQKKGIFARDK
jgi:hypothetical protein